VHGQALSAPVTAPGLDSGLVPARRQKQQQEQQRPSHRFPLTAPACAAFVCPLPLPVDCPVPVWDTPTTYPGELTSIVFYSLQPIILFANINVFRYILISRYIHIVEE
jgi:hypothetical protein